MTPYLFIGEDEWKDIINTYEKEDIVEELAKALHTYEPPIPTFTDKQTLDALKKLKGIWYNDLIIKKKWFPRNERHSDYDLKFDGEYCYIKRLNTGNNASNPFHIDNRWKVDWVRTPSGYKTWQTVKGIKTIVRAFFTLEKVLTKVDLQSIRMATTLRKYVASQFKPSVAKSLYDMFQSKNILEFAAGWGDRLVCFYACDNTKHYVGIDPNTNNHDGYKRQVEFYKKHQTFFEDEKRVDLIPEPAEDVDYSEYENHFDTIFTSPPYFNTEKYSDEDTQSYLRYKKIDDWNENFLHKALGKMIPTLKEGGILAVNIADVFNAPKNDYVEITNPMNDYLKSKGLKYRGCIGMEMTKRFNSGGAGKAKSEYFDKHLRDNTEKTEQENIAFGEPIWIWEKQ